MNAERMEPLRRLLSEGDFAVFSRMASLGVPVGQSEARPESDLRGPHKSAQEPATAGDLNFTAIRDMAAGIALVFSDRSAPLLGELELSRLGAVDKKDPRGRATGAKRPVIDLRLLNAHILLLNAHILKHVDLQRRLAALTAPPAVCP